MFSCKIHPAILATSFLLMQPAPSPSPVPGDKIYTPSVEERKKKKRLPSPEELREKILIVSSRSSDQAIKEGKPEAAAEEIDEYAFYGAVKKKRRSSKQEDPPEPPATPLILLPEWSELVALEHVQFNNIVGARHLASPWRLFSINEKVLEDVLEKQPTVRCRPLHRNHQFRHCSSLLQFSFATSCSFVTPPQDFVQFASENLVRAYPGGQRVDSDNMDASLAWAMGCQIVAINVQTADVPTQTMQSKFMGQKGYCLRPPFLNDKHSKYDPNPPQNKGGVVYGR